MTSSGWHRVPDSAIEVNVFIVALRKMSMDRFTRMFPRTLDILNDQAFGGLFLPNFTAAVGAKNLDNNLLTLFTG
jgi:hypothetical protein